MTDTAGDGRADQFETIHARTVSGNYHEYAFGPIILPNGDMLVTYNLGWTGSKMGSMTKWGGWMATISPDGDLKPFATGMRSPAGFGLYKNGDIFYAENQGGWGSPGGQAYGLQRLIWTGEIPFEIKKINATPSGFKITFTKPADRRTASDPDSYNLQSFTYKYHSTYGSPVINLEKLKITDVRLTDDHTSVYLSADGLREKYIHQIKASGVLSGNQKDSLLHKTGYYTLKNIPEGAGKNQNPRQPSTDDKEQAKDKQTKKHVTDLPESWTNGPDQVITINAIEGLRYDKTDFTVSAGAKVKLIFNNPTDLLHNLLITTPGTLEQVAKKALNLGLEAMARDYVPESDNVLYNTSLLEPNTNQAIYFTAPDNPDEYPYVCTFPGHYQTMQGTMTVTK